MGTALLTALDSAISNDVSQLGDANGFVIGYSSTTAVSLSSGSIEANGKNYTLAADTTHTMTSLASAFDFHYIYIDDSASTQPTAVIIDSITEPTFSDTKRGWYNGDDRCIGVVASTTGASTIIVFEPEIINQQLIYNHAGYQDFPSMATNMNPTDTWQIPDDNDGSVVTPVNAVAIKIRMSIGDVGSVTAYFAASKEYADINTLTEDGLINVRNGESSAGLHWMPLGISRDIRISGDDNDDNSLSTFCAGYGISR